MQLQLLKKMACATVLAVAALATNLANAVPFSQIGQIYFFGDSLSDSGFNDLWPTVAAPPFVPTLPAGKAPTFTTFGGYTWSQYVARDLKGVVLPVFPGPNPADAITNNTCCVVPGFSSGTLNGFNYASAGSTTNSTGVGEPWAPSLVTQVQTFLHQRGNNIQPNDVFFIWEGANDLLAVLSQFGTSTTQFQLLDAANTAAMNIAQQVSLLSSRGAKRFVIVSLPNIGRSPLIESFGLPDLVTGMKTVSFTFDGMLNQQLGFIASRYKINILYINAYHLLDNVINIANAGGTYTIRGQSFTFTNTTNPACGASVPAVYCTAASNAHVFADSLHPTDMAHRLLSLVIETQMMGWAWSN